MAPTGFSEKILDRSRAVKKKFVILTVVVLVSMPAWANLRAPKRVDGFLSGSLRSVPSAEILTVLIWFDEKALWYLFPQSQAAFRGKAGR